MSDKVLRELLKATKRDSSLWEILERDVFYLEMKDVYLKLFRDEEHWTMDAVRPDGEKRSITGRLVTELGEIVVEGAFWAGGFEGRLCNAISGL